MHKTLMDRDIERVLLSDSEIQTIVKRIAAEIDRDYAAEDSKTDGAHLSPLDPPAHTLPGRGWLRARPGTKTRLPPAAKGSADW